MLETTQYGLISEKAQLFWGDFKSEFVRTSKKYGLDSS